MAVFIFLLLIHIFVRAWLYLKDHIHLDWIDLVPVKSGFREIVLIQPEEIVSINLMNDLGYSEIYFPWHNKSEQDFVNLIGDPYTQAYFHETMNGGATKETIEGFRQKFPNIDPDILFSGRLAVKVTATQKGYFSEEDGRHRLYVAKKYGLPLLAVKVAEKKLVLNKAFIPDTIKYALIHPVNFVFIAVIMAMILTLIFT